MQHSQPLAESSMRGCLLQILHTNIHCKANTRRYTKGTTSVLTHCALVWRRAGHSSHANLGIPLICEPRKTKAGHNNSWPPRLRHLLLANSRLMTKGTPPAPRDEAMANMASASRAHLTAYFILAWAASERHLHFGYEAYLRIGKAIADRIHKHVQVETKPVDPEPKQLIPLAICKRP